MGDGAAAEFDAFPPWLGFRLRVAPVFTPAVATLWRGKSLRRGKSPRQAGATSLTAILSKIFTHLRFASAFVELPSSLNYDAASRRDEPTR